MAHPKRTLQHHFAVVATRHPDGTTTWGIDVEYPGFDLPVWDGEAEEWLAPDEDYFSIADDLGAILTAGGRRSS